MTVASKAARKPNRDAERECTSRFRNRPPLWRKGGVGLWSADAEEGEIGVATKHANWQRCLHLRAILANDFHRDGARSRCAPVAHGLQWQRYVPALFTRDSNFALFDQNGCRRIIAMARYPQAGPFAATLQLRRWNSALGLSRGWNNGGGDQKDEQGVAGAFHTRSVTHRRLLPYTAIDVELFKAD